MSRDPLDRLYQEVGALTGVGSFFIKGPSRLPYFVHARAVAVLMMRDALGMTWEAIGDELNRTHVAVLKLAKEKRRDPDVRRDLEQLMAAGM